ncbi:MAG: hypothetical protein EOP88_01405 [Verrucomicrobiaceae bacterium]|nr:MAG: hypothetical protein EOP88_01405 [Verrucomicrobiaceae bacterium]
MMNMKQAVPAIGALLALTSSAHALTWGLAGGNESWPADKRAAIIACMNEAVAVYNSHGHFDKHVTANYSPGVPTAQAGYSGWIDFGGSIGTRVAMHEIAHTLGVGTAGGWTNGGWWGPAANALVKVYDGQGAGIGTGGSHFWPYGLNYDNEDGTVARERHCKMVSAMRRDMGIVADSDSDGIPDDWETFNFGNLSQGAAGDPDGDGVSNLDEYNTDSNPNAAGARSGRTYKLRVQFSGKFAAVAGGSTTDGAVVQQVSSAAGLEQRWTAIHTGGGWWKFVNVKSGKALEVAGMSTTNGAALQQWPWLNNMGQQWRLADGGSGYWRICNRNSGQVFDVAGVNSADGTAITQWPDWKGGGQLWAFDETIPFANNSVYSLNAMHSNKVLDVQNPNLNDGANVGQYDWNGNNWQKWRVEDLGSGFMRLVSVHSGKLLEVAGASTANGGNIQQFGSNGNTCQNWRVESMDQAGVYRVINRNSGLFVDVAGVSTANGANVHQWGWLGATNQQWRFDPR